MVCMIRGVRRAGGELGWFFSLFRLEGIIE